MRGRSIYLAVCALLVAIVSPTAVAASSGNGAVFTLSNEPSGNRVLVWERAANGQLTAMGSVPTGGTGTGAGLGSQGALTLSPNHRWLYAVNPGSDEISVFRVHGSNLTLVEVASSGGDMPISVTARGRMVYVLNAGGDGNIQGFHRTRAGILHPIEGSDRPLSAPMADPAQISFTPDRERLVVTEKATNRITFYNVNGDGVAGPPDWRTSSTPTPFGFEFTPNGTLVVSEAAAGAPEASDTSSYRFRANGNLRIVDGSVATTETAACWVAISRNGRYAYVTNTGSGSVSGYRISNSGELTLLDNDGVTASTGAGSEPIDVAFDDSSAHLYVLLAGTDAMAIFRRMSDGTLDDRGTVAGLPAAAAGVAAY